MECIYDGVNIYTDGLSTKRKSKVEMEIELKAYPKIVVDVEKLDGLLCGYKTEVIALHCSVAYNCNSTLSQEELINWAFKCKIEFFKEALKNAEEVKTYYRVSHSALSSSTSFLA